MRSAAAIAVAVVLAVASQARGQVPSAVVEQLKRDATALVTVDRPPTSIQLALGLGLFALVAAADSHLVEQCQEHLPPWIDNFKAGGSTGSAYTVSAALIAGGLAFGERRVTTGGLTLLEGNVMSGVVVELSKRAFGRIRPNHEGPANGSPVGIRSLRATRPTRSWSRRSSMPPSTGPRGGGSFTRSPRA